MTYEHPGGNALDYQLCRYGRSRLLVRGPKERMAPPYAAFLGGTETFGRFVRMPFPTLLSERLGMQAFNLGCINAGVDVFAQDPSLMRIAAEADTTVIQIVGANNLSNRFYSVHPRRNDRFVGATPELRRLYPELDFTEFNFTRHLLTSLETACPERFSTVVEALQRQWLRQMKALISDSGRRTVLLWLAVDPPPQEAHSILSGHDPLFIDVPMIVQIAASAEALVQVVPSAPALNAGTRGMVFSEFEAHIAAETIGPAVHTEIADALEPVLERQRDAA